MKNIWKYEDKDKNRNKDRIFLNNKRIYIWSVWEFFSIFLYINNHTLSTQNYIKLLTYSKMNNSKNIVSEH